MKNKNSYVKQLEEQVAALEEQAAIHNQEYDAINSIVSVNTNLVLMVAVELTQLMGEDCHSIRFKNLKSQESKDRIIAIVASISPGGGLIDSLESIGNLDRSVQCHINNPKERTNDHLITFEKAVVPRLKEIVNEHYED